MGGERVTCPSDDTGLLSDYSAAAAGYTTLAAVLAGFAFSGLVLLLTVRMLPDAGKALPPSYPASVRALLAAFISLGIVAVNYAYLGGIGHFPGTLVSHAVFYGQAFAIGALQLIYAILLVIATAENSVAARFRTGGVFGTFQKAVIFGVAPFIALALSDGASEYRDLHPGSEPLLSWASWLPMAVVVVVAIVWLMKRSWRRGGRNQPMPKVVGAGTAVVALLTIGTFSGSFSPDSPCDTASMSLVVIATLLAGGTVGLLTVAVARYRVDEPDAKSDH